MIYENVTKKYHDGPILYYCGEDVNLCPGAKYGPVIRDVYIVECCTGGFGTFSVNGTVFDVKPGDCYVLMPGDTIIQTADVKEPRRGFWCAIDGSMLHRVLKSTGITSQMPFAPKEAFDEVCELVRSLVITRHEDDPGAEMRRSAKIYAILGALMRYSGESNKNAFIQKAVGIMELNYHQSISVEDIAAIIGLDRTYFSTLFKKETGTTPHHYLTALRIRKASVLLKQASSSVGDVAVSVGLDNKNFSRIFKKETGLTPCEYQNKHKKEI